MTEPTAPFAPELLEVVQAVPCGLLFVLGDGRIALANPAAERMFGYAPGELVQRPIEDLVPGPSRGAHRAMRANHHAGGDGRRMNRGRVVQGLRKDGEIVMVEIGLSPPSRLQGLTIASLVDVSLIAANADGLAVVGSEGELLYANPAAVELLDGPDGVPSRFPIPTLRGETVVVELRRPDGRRRWIEARMADIPWHGQSAVLASLRDDTERRQLQEQVHTQRRTALVGRLAAGVAHEFNNDLQVILAGIAAAETADDVGRAVLFVGMRAAAERSAALTRRLMDLGGIGLPGFDHLDVDGAVSELLPTLRDLVGAGIQVHHEPAHAPLTVGLEPGQLGQLLLDLVANARDAIGGPGRIDLVVSRQEAGPCPCDCVHPPQLERPHASILVRDDGPGVPPALRESIFEPFFSTKPPSSTSGLGLTACQTIVGRAQGHLCCDRRDGPGAVLRLFLPLGQATAPGLDSGEHPRVSGGRVLIVDDEQLIRTLLARHLDREGFDVAHAEGAEAALSALGEGPAFDLLVTDVVMPDVDGFQLAAEVERRHPGLPVLFISGYSGSAALARSGVATVDVDLLAKPFGMDEFTARVQRAISRGGGATSAT